MAASAAPAKTAPATTQEDARSTDASYMTPEEGRRLFDEAAQRLMGISGEEFIRRWEAGEYEEVYDQAGYQHIGDLAALISFARQEA